MTQQSKFRKLNRGEKCAICGKPAWCTVSGTGRYAKCMRVAGGERKTKDGGYIHRIDGAARPVAVSNIVDEPRLSLADCVLMQRQFAVADHYVRELAGKLGVAYDSLRLLDVGWCREKKVWTFPMRDASGKIVGFRTRDNTGNKKAIKGSREGLFLPTAFPTPSTYIAVVEGPTSLAALLSVGVRAIARPSCNGALHLLSEWMDKRPRVPLLMIADRDEMKTTPDGRRFWPGQAGAHAAAEALRAKGMRVQVEVCPVAKDCRDWLKAGMTKKAVDQLARMIVYTSKAQKGF